MALALSILLTGQPDAPHPVITWEPEKPAWGDTLTVTYHHDAPTAVFRGSMPLMVSIDYKNPPKILNRTQDSSTVRFVIPDSVFYVRLVVFSLEDWEPPRLGGTVIEVAVPEGWFSPEYSLEELRYRWYGFTFNRITRETLARELDSLRGTPPSALASYLTAYGYLLLGESDSAWATLAGMRAKYPQDPSYSRALMEFTYAVEDETLNLDPARIDTLWRWTDERITKGETDRGVLDWASIRWNEGNTKLSVKERERVLLQASRNEPLHYWHRMFLADHYLNAACDTAKAEKEYSAVIDLILSGQPQKAGYEPYGAAAFSRYLPLALLARAGIRSSDGRYEAALGDLSLLLYLQVDQEIERQALFEMGKAWQAFGRYRKAEEAYVKALKLGYTQAEPALKGIYALLHGSRGYENWLSTELVPKADEHYASTYDFGFTDLEGRPGRWSDLKGKIIVVNIWGLGCSPCLVEIPILNKLVACYQDEDVEFVAFNGDAASVIKGYLSGHPFDYRVLRPDLPDYSYALAANPYSKPWHIVVDPQGRVRFVKRRAFLDESELDGIKLVINQLLRERE